MSDPRQGVFQPHLLVNALADGSERPFLHLADGRTVTYRQFRDLVSCFGQALEAAGVGRGDRVALLSGNRPEVLVLIAACLIREYVIVPLHPANSVDDNLYEIDDSAASFLVFDAGHFAEQATAIAQRAAAGCGLLALGASPGCIDLVEQAAALESAPLVAPRLSGDETFRLSYTGGTTGRPKAVVGTYRSGLAATTILLAEWEWPAEVRQLVCAPLSHAAAATFIPTLMRRGSMVVLPRFDPLAVLEAIERHRITCMLVVPTMIYRLLDHPRFEEFDLTSLETVFYGAAPMSPERLREGIARLGPVFFQFYGQTEVPMTVTVLRRAEHDPDDPQRLVSCGRPVAWVDVALLDDDLRPVPRGEPGEICVRGPLVTDGYLGRPEQTRELFRGGWLHTGDVAVEDCDGYLRIVDRKKDIVISGGFNIYPREVEDALGTHPAVSNCAVVGVPDPQWGEALKAFVVLRPGLAASSEDLIDHVRNRKGSVHAPKSVDFLTEMPLTAVGKPDKKSLRSMSEIAAPLVRSGHD
jgi:fatty-acyl-CoA synthase